MELKCLFLPVIVLGQSRVNITSFAAIIRCHRLSSLHFINVSLKLPEARRTITAFPSLITVMGIAVKQLFNPYKLVFNPCISLLLSMS